MTTLIFFFVKNVQSWAKTDFFHEKKLAPWLWLKTALFLRGNLAQTQNYNSTLAFLKIPPSRRDIGPFPQMSWSKTVKKGGMVLKKGGLKIVCPPNFICVSDAKFDVDYDSAINHDLTQ